MIFNCSILKLTPLLPEQLEKCIILFLIERKEMQMTFLNIANILKQINQKLT